MKKWLRGFISGCIVMTMLMSGVSVYANGGVKELVEVMFNSVKLDVNSNVVANEGENYTLSNGDEVPFSILYRGTTYLPIRKMSELIQYDITWDGETNTVGLKDPSLVVETEIKEDIIEWVVMGYEAAFPYKEYEYKFVNGVKTDEYRYTGNYKEVPVFKNASFGDSKAQILATEDNELQVDIDNILFYTGKIVNLDASILYSFTNQDELYSIGCIINESHINKTLFINDYYIIQEALKEKFGEASIEELYWLGDLWKDNPADYGIAIATGDLRYETVWEFENYSVKLRMFGDNFEVTLGLIYESKVYEAPEVESGI